MDLTLVISFITATIILAIMPGPDNIFVLTESITKGHKNGILISLGLSLGVVVHTTAAATGLSIIIQQSALVFSIIKYAGALYMLYLAFEAYQAKSMSVNIDESHEEAELRAFPLIRKGFLMNVLNPKVSLFFIAFLPQFVSKNGYHFSVQMMILGLIFMLITIIIFSLIALLSGRLTKYVNSPRFWTITKWSKIGVLSLLALFLGFSDS